MNGFIDELSIYNRALTQEEIQSIYQAGSAGKCVPLCGNGVLDSGEQCDDGVLNGQPNQCNSQCTGITASVCGNNVQEAGEQCDDGNAINTDACNNVCVLTICGDGILQNPNGQGNNEVCDDGLLNGQPNQCNLECTGTTAPVCGNTIVESGEECDDGNVNSGDGCSQICTNEICTEPSSGLVSWWNAAGTWDDIVDGNDGIPKNGADIVPGGLVEKAFSFDGIDDYIQVQDANNLDVTSVTIEGWVKPDVLGDGFLRIVSKGSAGGQAFDLFINDNDVFNCIVRIQGSSTGFSVGLGDTPISGSVWTHVACTYDESTGIGHLYVNGEIKGIRELGAGNSLMTNNDPLYIGRDDSGDSQDFFKGLIDELSLYNRALSGEEIQLIYEAGSAGKCTIPTCEGISLDENYKWENPSETQGTTLTVIH